MNVRMYNAWLQNLRTGHRWRFSSTNGFREWIEERYPKIFDIRAEASNSLRSIVEVPSSQGTETNEVTIS